MAKKAKTKCPGKTKYDNPCRKFGKDGTPYCKAHKYLLKYNEYQLANLTKCKRCKKYVYIDENTKCMICKERKDKTVQENEKKMKCLGLSHSGKPCQYTLFNNTCLCKSHQYMLKYTKYQINHLTKCGSCKAYVYQDKNTKCHCKERGPKCIAKPGKNRTCRHFPINGTSYCDKHQYMIKYNEYQLNNLSKCSSCKKHVYKDKNTKCPCKEGKKKKKHCQGRSKNNNQCNSLPINNTKYCKRHQYMLEYNEYQLANLTYCSYCQYYVFKDENTKCHCRNGIDELKCIGLNKEDGPCPFYSANDTPYCISSHAYMNKYTEYQLANLQKCSDCSKHVYRAEGDPCEVCYDREVKKRLKEGKPIVKCRSITSSGNKCIKWAIIDGDGLCQMHQRFHGVPQEVLETATVCSRCNLMQIPNDDCPGCFEKGQKKAIEDGKSNKKCIAPACCSKNKMCNRWALNGSELCERHQYMKDYTPEMMKKTRQCAGSCKRMYFFDKYQIRCEKCAEAYNGGEPRCKGIDCHGNRCRNYSIKKSGYCKYHQYMKHYDEMLDDLTLCSGCHKPYYLIDFETCEKCRKRGKKNRDHYYATVKKCELKDCTFKVKENGYCGKHQRWRYIQEAGENGEIICSDHLRYNCKTILDPKYKYSTCGECRKKKRVDPDRKLSCYRKGAKGRNLCWKIDDEYAKLLMLEDCTYCHRSIDDNQINGIDRIDNNIGYTYENVTSCCGTCNIMKSTDTPDDFIHKCEHILTHLGEIDGKLHPKLFKNYKGISAGTSRYGAKIRDLCWNLTKSIYNDIVKNNCYLCGKKTSKCHSNGIDRFDSEEGYTIENSRPCCGDCNFMKNRHPIDTFISHLKNVIRVNGENIVEENIDCFIT